MRIAPFAFFLGAVFALLVTLQPINDSDLFWHIETGRLTLSGDLPRVDVFSWTVSARSASTPGQPPAARAVASIRSPSH